MCMCVLSTNHKVCQSWSSCHWPQLWMKKSSLREREGLSLRTSQQWKGQVWGPQMPSLKRPFQLRLVVAAPSANASLCASSMVWETKQVPLIIIIIIVMIVAADLWLLWWHVAWDLWQVWDMIMQTLSQWDQFFTCCLWTTWMCKQNLDLDEKKRGYSFQEKIQNIFFF